MMRGCDYTIFSKLRKLGVNLAVSNDRVFQMPVNYVILGWQSDEEMRAG